MRCVTAASLPSMATALKRDSDLSFFLISYLSSVTNTHDYEQTISALSHRTHA
jgi:hypothetical protein